MASFVNAADVIAAAVEIERRGHKFYENAAREAATPEAREFFEFMAKEELKHERIFESMQKRVGTPDLPFDVSNKEYLSYLEASLDSHMLFSEDQSIADKDPYRAAISFEKDTIVYFLAMLELVPESEKEHVIQCIAEEKGHMVLINDKRKAAGK